MPVRLTYSVPATRSRFLGVYPHHPFLSQLLIVAGYIGLYLALVLLGMLLPMPLMVSPWYPPPSLSLVLLLTFGLGYAPALFVSALLSQYWLHGLPIAPEAHVLIALIIMLGYTGSAAIVQQSLGYSLQIQRTSDLLKFIAVGIIAPLAISALSVAILTLAGLIPPSVYLPAVATWWIGDMLGILVFTPLLLIHVRPWIIRLRQAGVRPLMRQLARLRPSSQQIWEALGFFVVVGAVLWSALGHTVERPLHLLVLCVLPLLWLALRYGLAGTSSGIFAINISAVVMIRTSDYPLDNQMQLQLVLLFLVLAGLLLGTIVSEYNLVKARLVHRPSQLTAMNEHREQNIDEQRRAEGALDQESAMPERHGHEQTEEFTEVSLTMQNERTERARVETVLLKQDGLIQAIMANTQELISLTDSVGYYVYVSPAYRTVLGYNTEELLDTRIFTLVHDEDRELICPSEQGYQAAGAGPCILRLRDAQGGWRWFEATFTPTRYGDETYIVTVAQDITARREAEAERRSFNDKLQQTQKLESLGLLAGGIAHDFNNLLGSILGNVGLALLELPSDSPVQESIAQIEIATRRAADLIRQLLAYAGKGRLIIQPIDLNALISEMVQLLQATISKNVAIHYDFGPNLPCIEGDATEMRQVVMNLIVNAAEAIGTQPGAIRITTVVREIDSTALAAMNLGAELHPGRYVCLEIADTGCGMDAATRAKIFEPFFTTKFSGRGLGLAAVLGIIRGHHGTLTVESAPGQGTCFTILLPAKAEEPIPEYLPPTPVARGRRGTILLVDDIVDIRMVGRRILEQAQFSVLEAADGHTAVELVRAHADDISGVLLDVTMPHLDGPATAQMIHQIKPTLPIILMSGYSEDEVAEQFKQQRLAGFLQKPFTPQELQQVLDQAFREAT